MEPEGFTFDRPVTVLLSHSAVEDGAYTDYYDLNMQKLKIECEDLETERISKLEGNIKEVIFQVRVGVIPPISRYRETS